MEYIYTINFDRKFLIEKSIEPINYGRFKDFYSLLAPKDLEQILVFDHIFTKKLSNYLDASYPFSITRMRCYSSYDFEGLFHRMETTGYDSDEGKKQIKKWLYKTGVPFSSEFLVEGTQFSILLPFKLYIRYFFQIDWFMSESRAIELSQKFLFIMNHEKELSFASVLPDKMYDKSELKQFRKIINEGRNRRNQLPD